MKGLLILFLLSTPCLPALPHNSADGNIQLYSFLQEYFRPRENTPIRFHEFWYCERDLFPWEKIMASDPNVGAHSAASKLSQTLFVLQGWYEGNNEPQNTYAELVYCDGSVLYDLMSGPDSRGPEFINYTYIENPATTAHIDEYFLYARRWCEFAGKYGLEVCRAICYSPVHSNYSWKISPEKGDLHTYLCSLKKANKKGSRDTIFTP